MHGGDRCIEPGGETLELAAGVCQEISTETRIIATIQRADQTGVAMAMRCGQNRSKSWKFCCLHHGLSDDQDPAGNATHQPPDLLFQPWYALGVVWECLEMARWRPLEKKTVLKKPRIPKMCPPYKKPCKKLNRHRLLRKQILTPMKLLQDGQSRADRGHLHGNSAFRDLCSNILGDEEVSGPPCPALLLNWPGDLRRSDPVHPLPRFHLSSPCMQDRGPKRGLARG